MFLIKRFWLKNNENGQLYGIAGIEQQRDWLTTAACNIKSLLQQVNNKQTYKWYQQREYISTWKTRRYHEEYSTTEVTPTKRQLPEIEKNEDGNRSRVHTGDTKDTENIWKKNIEKIYIHKETENKC